MAQITITIPDNIKDRVLDGFCYGNGYQDSSGINKAAYAKSELIKHIKNVVKQYEISQTVQGVQDPDLNIN